jgi:hypothetical protein
MKLELGQKMKDVASGFKGIAMHKVEQLNGNVQYALQPKMAEGQLELPQSIFFDQHTLKTVDEGISLSVTKVPEPSTIKLGSRVKDIVSGAIGIATEKYTYLNGCEQFTVVTPIDPTKSESTGLHATIPAHRVRYVDEGILPELKLIKADEKTGKPPGGPGMRIPRNVAKR